MAGYAVLYNWIFVLQQSIALFATGWDIGSLHLVYTDALGWVATISLFVAC